MFRKFSMTFLALLVAAPVMATPYLNTKRTSTVPTKTRTSAPKPTQSTPPAAESAPAPAPAPAPTFGKFFLSATQNGFPASAQFQLVATDGSVVFSGASGVEHTVPAGTFTMKAVSNGATFTSSVVINKDLRTDGAAAFSTGRISLSISSASGSTGIAKIYQSGVEVGSIGSGNQITLATGTYDVKVLHAGSEKWFYGVALSSNQLRNISANF